MGDKNDVIEVTTVDTLVKTGHGILKAVYTTEPGDITWVVRNGVSAAGTVIFTVDGQAAANGFTALPYLNHPFNTGLFIDVTGGTTGRLLVVFE